MADQHRPVRSVRLRVPAFVAGLAAGVLFTRSIHGRTDDFWSRRLGGTRLRRGDLPVGGTVATAISLVAPKPLRPHLRAWALGAALGVTAVAVTDPLQAG
ncbi:MAG: hypothetical protein ACR2GX_00130 [Candidatus Dormibacteria bacterium]